MLPLSIAPVPAEMESMTQASTVSGPFQIAFIFPVPIFVRNVRNNSLQVYNSIVSGKNGSGRYVYLCCDVRYADRRWMVPENYQGEFGPFHFL
jgi:hypothetical protein